ncbi:sugar phosphate isomerase/epimerase [Candidatus Peregrinibacteria bacterium]|jgi:sugar phosphate isomerase/epimerase|nr:sugar phosphate isomerase/epimerase [Candidatus Peregrinibacteria bacterium]MBT7483429.1 sugar phosphate isomerase/epimerase [Candidatus Peregrinibacteria bacterium]MBT7703675.1 sugar phosphate isomerase/epimerase [Candidatus Peregrinibacteria bacterium]
MLITLSTESLKGYGLNRVFRFAKEAGFDGIDLAMENGHYDSLDVDYIKELSNALSLPIVAIQTPKATSKTKVEEAIRMAKKLGTRIIVIQPPKLLDVKLAKWLRSEIPKIRQKENISIALENASSKTMFGFIPEYAMASVGELKKFKHACLDTSRAAEKKEDVIRIYSALKKYLVHIHLSNIYRNKPYAPPETGSLPLESLLSKLKADKFKGAISIRVKPKNYHVGNEDKMMESLKSSLKFCRKYLEG